MMHLLKKKTKKNTVNMTICVGFDLTNKADGGLANAAASMQIQWRFFSESAAVVWLASSWFRDKVSFSPEKNSKSVKL